ncbi:MAG: adenosylcobalamin-dependent ribonucleoside-diphosphate reductase [Victivallaceae bacterium]|nr:adenosylcobalamin-dependent ribonucleoside-diphosphate reductase [Victivallaceae bacterium]
MTAQKVNYCDIGADIWERKYRYAGSGGIPGDKTIADTMMRVAKACASVEKNPARWVDKFAEVLSNFEFIPGGRIVANAGTSRHEVTMFNCYVMNKIPDSINGIFDTVKESAMTQKQGGGVGFDFSTIRPRGAHIAGCEAEASGPLSFMQVLDSTCRTIMSAGQRRGAQMGILRCDHPDIEEFIVAKRKNAQLQMFNLSVAITADFVEAVKADADWALKFNGEVHKVVKARALWDSIMHSTYDYAEPGFILIDRVNEMNNLHYCEEICATNPCGEQPLPPYGACLLGSINLTRFVENPFTSRAKFNFKRIEEVVPLAVRMLDNVIDQSNYPLTQQREEARSKRRMGIGITGLADCFLFLGIKYGSPESVATAGEIMRTITHAAYRASIELAKEKGAFPMLDKEKYLQSRFVADLPDDIKDGIREFGIRNSHLTSVAPTGTISLFAGNVSSGLEPVFAFSYTRKIRNSDENDVTEYQVADYAYRAYCKYRNMDSIAAADLPEYFVSADQITPLDHLEIQAVLQKYVDSAISKTINIPQDYPFEKFKDIYLQAYEKGLKGCTTFRPSEHIAGVLVRDEDKKKKESEDGKKPDQNVVVEHTKLVKRPDELEGTTYKIKTPLSPDAFYVTINDYNENGRRRPYELFINTKNLQHFSWIVAISRLISAVFRHDPTPTFLVDELKSVYDPNGGYFQHGKYMPSLAAEIGYVLEHHLEMIGILTKKHAAMPMPNGHENTAPAGEAGKSAAATAASANKAGVASNKMICPSCHEKELIFQENCTKCLSCGYSKCG